MNLAQEGRVRGLALNLEMELYMDTSTAAGIIQGFTGHQITNGSDIYEADLPYNSSSGDGKYDVNSSEALITAAVFFSIILSVGIIGNASVIWVICVYRSMRQAVMNLYILNMAVADLLLNILGLSDVVQFALDDGWVLGQAACKGMRFIMVCSLYVSILSLMAVAVERFVAILYPMQAHALLTKRRIMIAMVTIWIFSILTALPTAIFNTTMKMADGKSYCITAFAKDKETSDQRKTIYKFLEFTVFFAIPLIAQIILYFMITKKLRHSTARLKVSIDNSNNNTSDSSTPLKNSNDNWKTNNTVKSRRHVIKMLLACVIIYFISYTPVQVLLFYETFTNKPFHKTWLLKAALITLAYINSASNPIIYCICSESYRSRFKVMYGCDKERNRRARRLKSSLRSGESMRTTQTSSFRHSSNIPEVTQEMKELPRLQPLAEGDETEIVYHTNSCRV